MCETLRRASRQSGYWLISTAHGLERRWEVRRASPAELLEMLRRSPGRISRVVLDPIPEKIFPEAYDLLLSVELREFMECFVATTDGLSGSRVGGGSGGSVG